MNDIPTMQQEIERKAIETADELSRGMSQGKVSAEATKIGFRVLWQVTSGIVSGDISDLLSGLHAEIDVKGDSAGHSVVFVDKNTDEIKAVVSFIIGSTSFTIKTAGRLIRRDFPMEVVAKQAFKFACIAFDKLYKRAEL